MYMTKKVSGLLQNIPDICFVASFCKMKHCKDVQNGDP